MKFIHDLTCWFYLYEDTRHLRVGGSCNFPILCAHFSLLENFNYFLIANIPQINYLRTHFLYLTNRLAHLVIQVGGRGWAKLTIVITRCVLVKNVII